MYGLKPVPFVMLRFVIVMPKFAEISGSGGFGFQDCEGFV